MSVNLLLKMAFVVSVVIYSVVAIAVTGPPKWDATWIPADKTQRIILAVMAFLALGGWVAGWVEGHSEDSPQPSAEETTANPLEKPPEDSHQPGAEETTANPPGESRRLRFILAAALIEIGALCGLLASLTFKDSRYAIAAAVPAVLLLLLTPSKPASGPEQGASGESQ